MDKVPAWHGKCSGQGFGWTGCLDRHCSVLAYRQCGGQELDAQGTCLDSVVVKTWVLKLRLTHIPRGSDLMSLHCKSQLQLAFFMDVFCRQNSLMSF